MYFYLFFNFFLLSIYSYIIYNKIKNKNFIILKPSFIFFIFYFLFICLPASIFCLNSYKILKNPWIYLSLTHIFPVFSLFFCSKLFDVKYKKIWDNVSLQIDYKILCFYIFLFIISFIIYCSYVNIKDTGLYGILYIPSNSAVMRENSLKLLDSQTIKYVYSLCRSVICPVLLSLLIFIISEEKKYYFFPLVLLIFLFVLIPGERWPILLLLFSCLASLLYSKKIKISFKALFYFSFFCLMATTFFSIFREGVDWKNFDVLKFFERTFITSLFVLNRIIVVPMETGLSYFSFAENNFFWGIKGIEKLAFMFNEKGVNVPSYMYKYVTYNTQNTLPSGTYPTCFLFFYYSCFSYFSIIISFILIFLLDFIVFLYEKIHPSLLLPVLGSECGALISLVQSDYTVSLFTHGIILIPIVAVFISFLRNNTNYNKEIKNDHNN
jgi:hypothetical protein